MFLCRIDSTNEKKKKQLKLHVIKIERENLIFVLIFLTLFNRLFLFVCAISERMLNKHINQTEKELL